MDAIRWDLVHPLIPCRSLSDDRLIQRQTRVFDVPGRAAHDLVVPTPSALRNTMFARQTCFCDALQSLVIAPSRWRSGRVISMEIPVRIPKTRTRADQMDP